MTNAFAHLSDDALAREVAHWAAELRRLDTDDARLRGRWHEADVLRDVCRRLTHERLNAIEAEQRARQQPVEVAGEPAGVGA